MKDYFKKFSRWFFETGDARVAAALRMAYGLLFLYMLWDLYPSMDLVMGHGGLYGSIDRNAFPPYHPFGLLYFFDSPIQLQLWLWTSVAIAICVVLGLFTRVSVILFYYTTMLFYYRTPFILYGTDKVFLLCFIWILFLASDRRWSLDRYFRRIAGKEKSTQIELWPIKVIQLQIVLVYLLAAFNKITSKSWIDGSAVYYSLNFRPFVWEGAKYLTQIKPLMVFLSYSSLIAELSFPFLVFRKQTRWIAIGAVLFMHLGIDTLMHIRFFSLSMYIGYLAFIKPSEWEWLAKKTSQLLCRSKNFFLKPNVS